MNELFETFKDFKFFPDDHHYECNGKRIGTSVTTLIHEYTNPFDKEKVSKKISLKTGRPQEEILKDWELENRFSTIKGTLVHEYAQGLWNGEEVLPNYENIKDIDINRLKKAFEASKVQAQKFYNDYKDTFEVVKDEFIVGSLEYDIAGSIDNLFLNKENGNLVMIDYKTNKKIDTESFNHVKMLYPLDSLDDCNYSHYSLQLNIYKILIEKYTSIKVKNVFIVYFDETKDMYQKFRILNLQDLSKKLLESRICNQ